MPNNTVPAVARDLPSTRRAFLRSAAAAKLDLTTDVNPELIAALAEVEKTYVAFSKTLRRLAIAERAVRVDEDNQAARKALSRAQEAETADGDKSYKSIERFAGIRATTLPEFRLKATLADLGEFKTVAQSIIRDLLAS
ncbi:hypothetical protein [Methylocapsa palsarum]|uniref:Uncharacterized protein n=1 Tax=Methylocapsa palsarum TaxID=1612308 RepID=A0A1I3YCG7_9HYPH|nr:hypothetical protein [Methylocapsa palsarum]SFK28971.1 hypothetical protein SAMN05444581_105134 [Methylocapsa palsarum]